MVKVKVCGITNLEDALYAARCGADAIGFIFYKKSPRYIEPEKAKVIIRQLPKFVKKVGVFVNSKETSIRKIAGDLKLDILQFHGSESAVFCLRFKDFKVIKVFRLNPALSATKRNCEVRKSGVNSGFSTSKNGLHIVRKRGGKDKIRLAHLSKYDVWAYLFDTFSEGKFGGTGKIFNWEVLNCLKCFKKTTFLSGGLNPQNVRRALRVFSADWVDASSSLEKCPGKKDAAKIKKFIRNAKSG